MHMYIYVWCVYIICAYSWTKGRERERERERRAHTHRDTLIYFQIIMVSVQGLHLLSNWSELFGLRVIISSAFFALFTLFALFAFFVTISSVVPDLSVAQFLREGRSALCRFALAARYERGPSWSTFAAKDIGVSFAAFGMTHFSRSISLAKSLTMKTTMKSMKSLSKA